MVVAADYSGPEPVISVTLSSANGSVGSFELI